MMTRSNSLEKAILPRLISIKAHPNSLTARWVVENGKLTCKWLLDEDLWQRMG